MQRKAQIAARSHIEQARAYGQYYGACAVIALWGENDTEDEDDS